MENKTPFIAVVSGLPRSGTSLMMQMLEAAGIPPITDGQRLADDSNPRGYYELDAVKRLKDQPQILAGAEGKAVKVIHALIEHLPTGPAYRVLFMQRDIHEVIASQARMLERDGRRGAALPPQRLAQILAGQRDRAVQQLSRRDDTRLLEIDYRELIAQPAETARCVADFLDLPLNIDAMAGCVDPTLYREQSGQVS